MTKIDDSMHWTDHYVEYGFAVVPQTVGAPWLEKARAEVARLVGSDSPPHEWSVATVPHRKSAFVHETFDGANMTFLPTLYDEPGVRSVLDTMFGSPARWSGDRLFGLFVSMFDPDAGPPPGPHLDFANSPIPILGSGFMFQLSLVDTEPGSGNLLVYPGTHKGVIKALIENPDLQYPQNLQDLLEEEPYEFVAKAGDMILFHHLVGHGSSYNRTKGIPPRMVLHGQGTRDKWLTEVDAARPDLSPWERSLAVAGSYQDTRGEEKIMRDHYSKPRAA